MSAGIMGFLLQTIFAGLVLAIFLLFGPIVKNLARETLKVSPTDYH